MRKIKLLMGALVVALLVNCTESVPTKTAFEEYNKSDQERLIELNGLWIGKGVFTVMTPGYSTCPTMAMPIMFYIENGKAENMVPHEKCSFTTNVNPDGSIKFKYKDVGRLESDYPGSRSISCTFSGKLSGNFGKGTFHFSNCPGKWEVHRKAVSREDAEMLVKDALKKPNN